MFLIQIPTVFRAYYHQRPFIFKHFGVVTVKGKLLCISTSKQVLRTPFPGQNRLSDAKTTFSITKGTKNQKIKGELLKIMQNMQ